MNETTYWLTTGGEASGPFTVAQIRAMFRSGAIPATALVCPQGGQAWQAATEVIDADRRSRRLLGVLIVLLVTGGLVVAAVIGTAIYGVHEREEQARERAARTWEEMGIYEETYSEREAGRRIQPVAP